MTRVINFIMIMIFIAVLPGCNKLRRSWTKEDYKGRHYTTIAVVGLSGDAEQRKRFEDFTIGLLVANEIKAVRGADIFQLSDQSESDIEQKVFESKLDGVLTVGLAKKREGGILPENYNKFSKFYANRFTELNMQRYMVASGKYVMEAHLYDLSISGNENLVWRGEMSLLDTENEDAKERFMKRMVNHLISDKLLHVASDPIAYKAGWSIN